MGGFIEAFKPDDRVEVTVNSLISYFRTEAKTHAENKVLINGLQAGLPADHILTMVGKNISKEEEG